MTEICNDNRFELIEEFKKKLIESTNIETSPEEMKVIDNILFRFWQIGWLESIDRMPLVKESAKTLIRSVGDSVSAKAFRNAGRFMQNAIDGEAQEYEFVQASSEIPNNSDTISRQDAIKDIRSMDVCVMYDDMCSTEDAVEKAIVATKRNAIFGLERMPSASPDLSDFSDKLWKIAYERGKTEGRKKGKWIYGEKSGQDGWYCSECGGFIPWDYDFYGLDNIDFIEDFKTCPFCDSKMVSYTGADTKEGEEDG